MMLSTFILFVSSFAVGTFAVPAPGPCTGSCGTHDPALIRRASDGTYFRFTTNGHIGTASAPSISGPWTNRGPALPGAVRLSQGSDIWAPDVSLVGDTYYMYYAVSSFGSQNSGIGLATSTTLEPGSWTDHGSIGLDSAPGKPYNSIDPNLVKSGNDCYLNLGSFWGDIYQARLSTSMTSPATTPINVIYNPEGAHAIEGSFTFQNGDLYYMFWSAGQCCNLSGSKPAPGGEYMIKVCRSTSVSGSYVDQAGTSCTKGGGSIVLQSHDNIYAPGGQGVMSDPVYGPVLYYHYMNTDIGIQDGQAIFGWNPLSFESGWPVVQSANSKPETPTTLIAVQSLTSKIPTLIAVQSPTAKAPTLIAFQSPTAKAPSPSTAASITYPASPLYGQCGGNGWNGPTSCAQGTCKMNNEWYSQCQ